MVLGTDFIFLITLYALFMSSLWSFFSFRIFNFVLNITHVLDTLAISVLVGIFFPI